MKRTLTILLTIVFAGFLGYIAHPDETHYIIEETVKHDCAISALSVAMPIKARGR